MKHVASNFAKLEKFEGVDFRRWQKKIHFLLSSMSVVYVLTTPMPEDGGDMPTVEQNVETSKELWDTLKAKYMAEDASSKKFLDNDKPKGNNVAGPSVVDMVEHNNSSRYNDNKGKRKHHDTRADPNKISKVTCWKYGKLGHLKRDCKAGNDDDVAWWVDSGVIVHVCKDRRWFKTYESLNDRSILHMENESTALMHGRGCVDLRAVVRLPDPKLKTLGERGIECIFVGYAEHSKAFRFYVIEPNDSISINSIIESRDAIFDEHRFLSVPRPSQRSLVKGTKDSGGLVVLEKVTEEVVQQPKPELRKSKRHRIPKDFGPEFQLYLIEGTRDEVSLTNTPIALIVHVTKPPFRGGLS
ncbi:zinc finger, CCHC-type containing protein [Tanacetum coccineum]